jgi:hypothetical protein
MSHKTILLALISLAFVCCKKKESPELPVYYYSYYPVEVGNWISYEVMQIEHTNLGSDTLTYLLKEKITEEFIDDAGDQSYRIERLWKFTQDESYSVKDIWYTTVYATRADKIEENVRFTKLIFPINMDKRWNGNAFNTLEKWDYKYDSLHLAKTINGLQFDSTIQVNQSNVINPFQQKVASEIYANHVGLVHKSYKNIDNGIGRELYMTVSGYGKD